jgi:hypothetical protein
MERRERALAAAPELAPAPGLVPARGPELAARAAAARPAERGPVVRAVQAQVVRVVRVALAV